MAASNTTVGAGERTKRRRALAAVLAGSLALLVAAVMVPFHRVGAESVPNQTTPGKKMALAAGWGDAAPVFYAYASAVGETIVFTANYAGSMGDPTSATYKYVIKGPNGSTYSGEYGVGPNNPPKGLSFPVMKDWVGVWKFSITSTGTGELDIPRYRYDWDLSVRDSSGTEIPGRVWTQQLFLYQDATQTASFPLYVMTTSGTQYKVVYNQFNGIYSIIQFSALGNVLPGTCTQVYGSYSELSTENPKKWETAPPSCGSNFNIFVNPPAPDLPESFTNLGGAKETFWIAPKWKPPAKPVVSYERTGEGTATPFAGKITVTTDNFVGSYDLQIDTDGNGSYTDAADITLPVTVSDSPHTHTYTWDGKDAAGQPVTTTAAALTARVTLTQADEIHSNLYDVEYTGGQTWTQLVGNAPGPAPLMWDDSYLAANAKRPDTPGPSVTQGWPGTTEPNVRTWGAVDGDKGVVAGYWGDASMIDTWTYAALPASSNTQVEIPLSAGGLRVIKKATPRLSAPPKVNDTISYTITATNGGNETLTEVTLDDPMVTIPAASYEWPDSKHPGQLLAGESVTATATYSITQADIDAGTVRNTATASATSVDGDEIASDPNDPRSSTDTEIGRVPGLSLAKSATPESVTEVGDVISYRFKVTNTGNVTVTGLSVEDVPDAPAGPLTEGPDCPVTTLAPGATTTCTGSYKVTQQDLDHGAIDDTATASADPPAGLPGGTPGLNGAGRVVSNESSASVEALVEVPPTTEPPTSTATVPPPPPPPSPTTSVSVPAPPPPPSSTGSVSVPAPPPPPTAEQSTRPGPPVITGPADGMVTDDPHPPITGTGDGPGDAITVTDTDGSIVCTATVGADKKWLCVPEEPLAEGPHTFTATETDPAGDTSDPSNQVTVTIDSEVIAVITESPTGDPDSPDALEPKPAGPGIGKGGLAATGAAVLGLLLVAAILIGTGVVGIGVARGRHTGSR